MSRSVSSSGPVRHRGLPPAAVAVLLAGVSASLHLGKLAPAVPALQAGLGINLVQAGFLLGLVQMASMTLGLVAGVIADGIGARRCMLMGLALLAVASLAGGFVGASEHAVRWLLALRAVEGVGFLMVAMPGPGLMRKLVTAETEKTALGFWGAYMPFGVALALLVGPALIAATGWEGWWWALALVSAGAMAALIRLVPPDDSGSRSGRVGGQSWSKSLTQTLRARGPWLGALVFCVYSSQWMAVIGFLPAIYANAGVPAVWMAPLTAFAAAMNIVGNVLGGRFLQKGVPSARLLRLGFAAMVVGAVAAFAQVGQGSEAVGLSAVLRYLAVCLFSLGGGMVPATLFMLAVRVAPAPQAVSTTVGLMLQASALGQFLAPPFVAWLAHRVGGWHWTWAFATLCSLVGVAIANALSRAGEGAHE